MTPSVLSFNSKSATTRALGLVALSLWAQSNSGALSATAAEVQSQQTTVVESTQPAPAETVEKRGIIRSAFGYGFGAIHFIVSTLIGFLYQIVKWIVTQSWQFILFIGSTVITALINAVVDTFAAPFKWFMGSFGLVIGCLCSLSEIITLSMRKDKSKKEMEAYLEKQPVLVQYAYSAADGFKSNYRMILGHLWETVKTQAKKAAGTVYKAGTEWMSQTATDTAEWVLHKFHGEQGNNVNVLNVNG